MKICLAKKDVTTYKLKLKKMLTCVSKFGKSKNNDDLMYLYHYISKSDGSVHPVFFIDQEVNPWGEEFYPAKLAMTGTDFPKDIELFSSKSKENLEKYHISKSMNINIALFRKETIDKLSEVSYDSETFEFGFPCIMQSNTDSFYVDILKESKSVTEILKYVSQMKVISDENVLRSMHEGLISETTFDLKSEHGTILKILYSICPLKLNRFEYCRRIDVSEREMTSTVYCRQFVDMIVIHNFYKYIDIWSLEGDINDRIRGENAVS